jgi:hypothetical protein
MRNKDAARWLCRYKLSKYHHDIEPYRDNEAAFYQRFRPTRWSRVRVTACSIPASTRCGT